MIELESTGIEASSDDARLSAPGGKGKTELVYVGFWRRLAAHLIDLAILFPYAAIITRTAWNSKYGYIGSQIVGFIVAVLFNVYLVKRFGGSPGKLAMRVRIAKMDGSAVGYKEASIRYSVLFLIGLVSSAGLVISALNMPDSEYAALTRETRTKHLEELAPAWYQKMQIVGAIWVYSEFAVLLTNRKRRALHDFMAGTVVIRA